MIGQVVGQYKILEKLGEGGMGAVYKGVDLMVEREVAIKMLRPEIARQPELVERFRSEAVTLAKLNYPGIAMLYAFFRQGEDFFMVMEFVAGRTLESLIRESGAMPWDRAVPLFSRILEAIEPAHQAGVLHRDIKPSNIMLNSWGGIKVMDFGIARVLGAARLTREGRIVGTIEYIAPERLKGVEADARGDIYSLGVVLYEMLTGRLPFENDSEFEIMRGHVQDAPPPMIKFGPNVPATVEAVVMRALAKAPEDRIQSCSAFLKELQNATQGLTPAAPQPLQTPARGPLPTRTMDYMPETRFGAQPGAPPAEGKPTRFEPAPPPYVAPVAQVPAKPSRAVYMIIGAVAAVAVLALAAVEAPKYFRTSAVGPPPSSTPTPAQSWKPQYSNSNPQLPPAASSGFNPGSPTEIPLAGTAAIVATPSPGVSATPLPRRVEQVPTPARPPHEVARTDRQPDSAPPQAPNAAPPPPPLPPAPAVSSAELQKVEDRLGQLSPRMSGIDRTLQRMEQSQNASGLGMRADYAQSRDMMHSFFSQAEAALRNQDVGAANRYLDRAEIQVDKLAKALNQ